MTQVSIALAVRAGHLLGVGVGVGVWDGVGVED